MDSLSTSRLSLEFAYFELANSPWIYFFRGITMNSISFLRFQIEFALLYTICFTNPLWIHSMLPDFSLNSLSVSRIHLRSTIFFAKPLWIRYEITMNSLFFRDFTRITSSLREFTICFANSAWIHYFFEITMKSLGNHHESTIKSLWIHYLLCEFDLYRLVFEITINLLWNHYKTAIRPLWIYCLLRDFSLNSPTYFKDHYECTIFSRNQYKIRYLLRDFPMN